MTTALDRAIAQRSSWVQLVESARAVPLFELRLALCLRAAHNYPEALRSWVVDAVHARAIHILERAGHSKGVSYALEWRGCRDELELLRGADVDWRMRQVFEMACAVLDARNPDTMASCAAHLGDIPPQRELLLALARALDRVEAEVRP